MTDAGEQPKKKRPRGKPLSLYPLSLEEAVGRALKAKPCRKGKRNRTVTDSDEQSRREA